MILYYILVNDNGLKGLNKDLKNTRKMGKSDKMGVFRGVWRVLRGF